MSVHYDRIERAWRAEDAAGAVLGYFTSEALALAVLPSAAPAALTLSDGTPVIVELEPTTGRPSGVLTVNLADGASVVVDDAGYVGLGVEASDEPNDHYRVEDVDLSPGTWQALKRLVLSGVVDELLALATGKQVHTARQQRKAA